MVDLFGVEKYIVSCIMRECCSKVRLHLQKRFMRFPSKFKLCKLVRDFEALHDILYVVGAMDGFHILVLAPVIGGEDYYCHKSFDSTLSQSIVETNYIFFDY